MMPWELGIQYKYNFGTKQTIEILYTLDIVKQRIFDQEGQEIYDTCVNVEHSRYCFFKVVSNE